MRRHLFSLPLLALVALLLVAPFAFGYAVGYGEGGGSPRTNVGRWLARVGLIDLAPERAPVPGPSPELDTLFKPFWEAWGYVNQEFYIESGIDPQKMSRAAIRGALTALDDPYTLYLDPLHREVTEGDLRGAFDGIGVQIEMVGDLLQIISPLESSPGERAGLRPGDFVTHVDGQEIKGTNLLEAIQMIRGPRGTTVTLTIRRVGRAPFDVGVTRDEIRIPAVRGEVRSDGVGYIRITNFSQRVGNELRQLLDRLAEAPGGPPRAYILDLRGNPGGYLDGAISVASQFIDDTVVLYEERRGGQREELRTRGRSRASNGRMAVLVDGGTASAAEIVAGALRDHGRATLVGEQTYGKGTVQVIHGLSDGSALRITIARWLTPHGDPIQGVGLRPEVLVAVAADGDAALEQAVELVRGQPARSAVLTGEDATEEGPTPLPRTARLGMADRLDPDDAVSVLDSVERVALMAEGTV